MKSDITSTDKTSSTITITLDQDALKPYAAETFNKLRPRVKAAGFRPGKAPDHVIERELGSGAVQSEVLEAAIMGTYAEAVKKHELAVIDNPNITVTKFVPYTDLEYTAKVDVLPEIKLPDYTKIKKKRAEVKVEDKEVEQALEDLRKRAAKKETVDRPAAMGDEVTFDFEGRKDGELVPGAAAKAHTLMLGSKSFIPGFEEELVGLKQGDKKTFDIKFPDDYQEESLKGQTVTFAIEMHEVKEERLPEVNDELAAEAGPFKTVDELKADLRRNIEAGKRDQAAKQYEEELLEEIADKAKFEVPQAMVERQLESMKEDLKNQLGSMGLDIEQYLQMGGKDMSELDKEMRPQAEKRVKLGLVISEVAKQEGIKVEHDEIHAEIDRLKKQYPDAKMQAELDTPKVHDEIGSHLMASRTIAKLIEYADQK